MRYMKRELAERLGVTNSPNIHCTGSVRGMQQLYGWPKGGQVRVGSWIYNIGPAKVEAYRNKGYINA